MIKQPGVEFLKQRFAQAERIKTVALLFTLRRVHVHSLRPALLLNSC